MNAPLGLTLHLIFNQFNFQFNDQRDDYVENEVTLDYNAGFQSLAAGLRTKACP